MPAVLFTHSKIGTLQIDNGIDEADWGYNLNTQSFPTYGGEVVQILSVNIDDLTLTGTCSTYAQVEAIYRFFIEYLIKATQGASGHPEKDGYDLEPMLFIYGERKWKFKIYPKMAPGFRYSTGMAGPQWQLQAHIIDDSPDLAVIQEGVKEAIIPNGGIGGIIGSLKQAGTFSLTGNINPKYGNPNADPFQTFDPRVEDQQAAIKGFADFYSSLIPAYMKGDFTALTGITGSQPNFGRRKANQTQIGVPKTKKIKKK